MREIHNGVKIMVILREEFGERAKSDLDDEYKKDLSYLKKARQGRILVEEELERRSKELNYAYQNKVHQINSLLNPNHPTTYEYCG